MVTKRPGRRPHAPDWAHRTMGRVLAGLPPRRRSPDLVLVGAKRAGTTSLYDWLAAHPGVAVPRGGKGTHGLDLHHGRGDGWMRSRMPSTVGAADRVVVDASPYLMFHPLGAQRLAERFPQARAVVLLRDPLARARSHHRDSVRRGAERLGLVAALEAEDDRLAGTEERLRSGASAHEPAHVHHSYRARSDYRPQVERLHAALGADRVLLLRSEALFATPERVLRRVERFAGITPTSDHGLAHLQRTAAPGADLPVDLPPALAERFAALHEDREALLHAAEHEATA